MSYRNLPLPVKAERKALSILDRVDSLLEDRAYVIGTFSVSLGMLLIMWPILLTEVACGVALVTFGALVGLRRPKLIIEEELEEHQNAGRNGTQTNSTDTP